MLKVPAWAGIIYAYNYFLRKQVISIMMEKLRNPKNVKTISLIVAAIFVIGCFTLAMSAGGFGSSVASAASSESAIGVVDYQVLVSQSPQLEQVRSDMQKAVAETRREFDNNSQNMNEEEKERYYRQMQERLATKEKELMDPVLTGINDTIKKIAEKKAIVAKNEATKEHPVVNKARDTALA